MYLHKADFDIENKKDATIYTVNLTELYGLNDSGLKEVVEIQTYGDTGEIFNIMYRCTMDSVAAENWTAQLPHMFHWITFEGIDPDFWNLMSELFAEYNGWSQEAGPDEYIPVFHQIKNNIDYELFFGTDADSGNQCIAMCLYTCTDDSNYLTATNTATWDNPLGILSDSQD